MYVPGEKPEDPAVALRMTKRADPVDDPMQIVEMRRHNGHGSEAAQRRIDAHAAMARAIRRSGIDVERGAVHADTEYDPKSGRVTVAANALGSTREEMVTPAAYYAAKACALQGTAQHTHREDLTATVTATLVAHRMACKAGRPWKGPQEPLTLKEAGRLLQREPETLAKVVQRTRAVEARMTPGNPD